MKLRPYQNDAVDSIIAELGKFRSTLIVLPTGCGKTVCFSEVINRYPQPGRWMVLAHREELIRQAADKIGKIIGETPEIEMADERADLHMFRRTKAVVATVQTLSRGRKARFAWKDFAGIIIDEAHHAVADSYQNIVKHARTENPDIKVVGVTATPDRADEAALGHAFESVAYVYEITDAINDGYLVPIHARGVEVKGLDFSKIRTTAGDLNSADLAAVMEYEENLHKIAGPCLQLAKWRKVLVFAASLAHAERLCEIFNRYRPNSARWFSGKTPKDERRLMLADFAAGHYQFLVNVGVLTEGYDEPTIDMVVMARPTKSRALYSQMVGRGTRPLPGVIDGIDTPEGRRAAIAASEKPNVEILDFVGVAGHHKLVTSADILSGAYPDEVVERATKEIQKAAKQGGSAPNVQEALAKADRDIHAEREAEKAKRAKVVANDHKFTVNAIDPFDVFGIDPPRQDSLQKGHEITDRQKAMLESSGIDTRGLDRSKAGKLCQEIISRREGGRCTFKQAKTLAKYGYDTNVTFKDASAIIDSLAKNGWKRPAEKHDAAWTNIPGAA